jgi:hypothetical protein
MFLQRRKLELVRPDAVGTRSRHPQRRRTDLYEEPFTNFGANAVEKLFGESEIAELIELAKRLAA